MKHSLLRVMPGLSFYWSHFLTGFCYRLPLPVSLLLVLGLLMGEIGSGYGVPLLVVHEQPLKAGLVGFALTLVWLQCLLIGYLLRDRNPDEPDISFARYAWYISACVLVSVGLVSLALFVADLVVQLFGRGRMSVGGALSPWVTAGWRGGLTRAGAMLLGGGAAVGLLAVLRWLATVCDFVSDWFGRGLTWMLRLPTEEQPAWVPLGGNRRALALLLVAAIPTYILWTGLESWLPPGWYPAVFVLGFVVVVVFLTLLLRFAGATRLGGSRGTLAGEEANHATTLAFLVVGGASLITFAYVPATASPVVAVAALWVGLLGGYGFVVFYAKRVLPVVVLVSTLMMLLGGLPAYKYPVPGLEHEVRVALRGSMQEPDGEDVARQVRPPRSYSADDWQPTQGLLRVLDIDHRHGDSGVLRDMPRRHRTGMKRPLVVIAVSGGGIRAAVWTLAVLQRLEHDFARAGVDFPAHVRVITGASGGMLGASYYTATLPAVDPESAGETRGQRDAILVRRFDDLASADFLTPIVREMVFRDAPCFFSQWTRGFDRGRAMEASWREHLNGKLDLPFAQLRTCEQLGCCPSLIFYPMMVEDGRRLLISNLDLKYVASNDGNMLGSDDPEGGSASRPRNYSQEAIELFRLFPASQDRLTLSTAARLSASFPYASPSPTLPTIPRRRMVDAGYYDNDGTSIACSWLFSGMNQKWIEQNISRVVLIQIRDARSDAYRRLDRVPDDGSTLLGRALEQLTTPLEGLWRMRISSTSFRNDGQLEQLSQFFNERDRGNSLEAEMLAGRSTAEMLRRRQTRTPIPQRDRRFTVVNFEFPYGNEVSLSWSLSRTEVERIREAAGWPPNGDGEDTPPEVVEARAATDQSVQALLEWWMADAP